MELREPLVLPMPRISIRPGSVFALMPDGERIVVSGTGPKSTSRMVSLASGQDIFTFEKTPQNVREIAVSEDGAVVAFAAIRDRVTFYNAASGTKTQALNLKPNSDAQVSGLAFTSSSTLLYSSWDRLLAIQADSAAGTRILDISAAYPNNTMRYALALSASSGCFASVWSDHGSSNLSLYEWPFGNEIKRLPISNYDRSYCLDQMIFSPDSHALLLTTPSGSVSLLPISGDETTWIEPFNDPQAPQAKRSRFVGRLSFSPDGTLLAYGINGLLGLWRWPSGRCLGKWKVPGRDPLFYQIGFSKSGREIVASYWSAPMGIHVYRLADFINSG